MRDPGRRGVGLVNERSPVENEPPTHRDRWHQARRYVVWLALVPAAFAAYFWLPWPETSIETGLLLGLIACAFVIYEMSRF